MEHDNKRTIASTPKEEHGFWPEHVAELNRRAIPLAKAWEYGLRSYDLGADKAMAEKYGTARKWKNLPSHPVKGILIPYQPCLDGIERVRFRSDVKSYVRAGDVEGAEHHGEETIEVPRYVAQGGVGVVPYLLPEVLALAGDTSQPLWVVEAPLKAIKLTCEGWPAIGLGGVLAGAHAPDEKAIKGITAHPELATRIDWRGRTVYVSFDAGLADTPNVALGVAYVWWALRDKGADLRLVTIPYYHPQDSDPENGHIWQPTDQGPDDYLVRCGREAYQARIDESILLDPIARLEAIAAGPESKDSKRSAASDVLAEPWIMACLKVASSSYVTQTVAVAARCGVGARAVRDAAKEFAERLAMRARAAEDRPAWLDAAATYGNGDLRPTRENVELALRNDGGLAGMLAFDEFAQAIVFAKAPPWVDQYSGARNTKPGDPWTDEDDIRLGGYVSRRFGLHDVQTTKLRDAVRVVAHDKQVHPVRDYLSRLEWDQVPRVENWLSDYLKTDATDYTRSIGKWWLISAVARVFQPGCKVDDTLILEGEQGVGKSSVFAVLGGPWYSDGDLGDLKNKEAALGLQGRWIVELAEGEIFSRASTRALKAFTTKSFDDLVPKYSNLPKRILRQFVLGLTTNDEADYLVDPTGNRRWWPVRVGKIEIERLKTDRDQLWAEAVHLFRSGVKWWPQTPAEEALCRTEQTERETQDVWHDSIATYIANMTSVSIADVLTGLDVPHGSRNDVSRRRVGAVLKALGWESYKSSGAKRWRPASTGDGGKVIPFRRSEQDLCSEDDPYADLKDG